MNESGLAGPSEDANSLKPEMFIIPETKRILDNFGLTIKFFEDSGIDLMYFQALPESMQLELISNP